MKKRLMRFNLAALALVMVTSVLISGTFAKYTTAVSAQDTALIARWNISSTGMGEITYDGEGNPQIQEMDLFGHAYSVAINNNDGGTPILGPGVEDSFDVNLTGIADVDATIDLNIVKTTNSPKAPPIQYAITDQGGVVDWENAEIYYSEKLLAQAILNKMVDNTTVKDNTLEGETEKKVLAGVTTDGKRPIILVKNETDEPVVKNVTVHWRWPFDTSAHKAQYKDEMTALGITGSGEEGAWVDADDTELGQASAVAAASGERTSYNLTLTLTAEQVTPSKP